jgi:cell division protease FtsH
VAQIKKYGQVDGMDIEASSDLKHAINEAYIAITHYGMDKEVRFVNLKGQKHPEDKESNNPSQQECSNQKVDEAIDRWMRELEQETIELIDKNWAKVEALAKALLDKEIMYSEDLEEVV